jgi:hypothetical protein
MDQNKDFDAIVSRHLIVGMGEVGSSLFKYLCGFSGLFVDTFDTKEQSEFPGDRWNVVHVCFPYSSEFVELVRFYSSRADLVVVHSTVPVGTIRETSRNVVHMPLEGVHPNLWKAYGSFMRIVGFNNKESYGLVKAQLDRLFPKGIHMVYNTDKTELGKLLSTGYRYPSYIKMAQAQERICRLFGLPYEEVVTDYDRIYNEGFMSENRGDVLRPLSYPGAIGGHCIKPNMKMLEESISNTKGDADEFNQLGGAFLHDIWMSDDQKRKEISK